MPLGPGIVSPGRSEARILKPELASTLFYLGSTIFNRLDSYVSFEPGCSSSSYPSKKAYYPHDGLENGQLMSAWIMAKRTKEATLVTQVVRINTSGSYIEVHRPQFRLSVIGTRECQFGSEFDRMSEDEQANHTIGSEETIELVRQAEGITQLYEYA